MNLALFEAGASYARTDGVGRLAHEQRFVPGNEIGPGWLTLEMGAEAFER